MRSVRTLLLAAALAAAGCAHVEAPSGGPEDREAPALLTTRPDTMAVVPGYDGPAVLVFTERISERGVEEAVIVSPRTSPVVVDRGSDEIRVSLRRGWQPGIIYHVAVRPTLQDLFNNRLAQPVSLVFSTGPRIPANRVSGSVIDRISGKGEAEIRVEAILRSDSLVYALPTDSAGGFSIAHVPPGSYLVRAYRDLNRNRALDVYEPRDTAAAQVAESDSASVRLSIVAPDSTAPKLASAQVGGEGRVELRFDDYLDPAQTLVPASVQIVDSAGVFVPVAAVEVAQEGATALALPRDTTARDTTAVAPDSVAAPVPVRLPSQRLSVQLAEGAALVPQRSYRVVARGIRNVVGLTGDGETNLVAPAAPPPAPAATPLGERPPAQPVP